MQRVRGDALETDRSSGESSTYRKFDSKARLIVIFGIGFLLGIGAILSLYAREFDSFVSLRPSVLAKVDPDPVIATTLDSSTKVRQHITDTNYVSKKSKKKSKSKKSKSSNSTSKGSSKHSNSTTISTKSSKSHSSKSSNNSSSKKSDNDSNSSDSEETETKSSESTRRPSRRPSRRPTRRPSRRPTELPVSTSSSSGLKLSVPVVLPESSKPKKSSS